MAVLENVNRVYRMGNQEIFALKDLSLELSSGKLVVVLGPSGSGKTTLLNVLGGIDDCTSGKIRVANRVITDRKAKKLALCCRGDWPIGPRSAGGRSQEEQMTDS